MVGDSDTISFRTLATCGIFTGFITSTDIQKLLAFSSCHSGNTKQPNLSLRYGNIFPDLGFSFAVRYTLDRMDEIERREEA